MEGTTGKCFWCRGETGHETEPLGDILPPWTPNRLLVEAVDGRRRKMPPVYFASWFIRQTPETWHEAGKINFKVIESDRKRSKLYLILVLLMIFMWELNKWKLMARQNWVQKKWQNEKRHDGWVSKAQWWWTEGVCLCSWMLLMTDLKIGKLFIFYNVFLYK